MNNNYENLEVETQNQLMCDSVTQNNEQNFSELIKQVQTNLFTQLLHYHFVNIQLISSPSVNITKIDHTHELKKYKTNVFTKQYQTGLSILAEKNISYTADMISQKLINEQHTELCNFIYNHSCDANTFRLDVSDSSITNLNKLYNASNLVSQQTNRGRGNKWILPKNVFDNILPRLHDTKFVQHNTTLSLASELSFVGTFNDNIEIFVSSKNTVALIIYKSNIEMDTGYVYSPYQFIYNTDKTSNIVSFYIRQAFLALDNNYCMNIQVR